MTQPMWHWLRRWERTSSRSIGESAARPASDVEWWSCSRNQDYFPGGRRGAGSKRTRLGLPPEQGEDIGADQPGAQQEDREYDETPDGKCSQDSEPSHAREESGKQKETRGDSRVDQRSPAGGEPWVVGEPQAQEDAGDWYRECEWDADNPGCSRPEAPMDRADGYDRCRLQSRPGCSDRLRIHAEIRSPRPGAPPRSPSRPGSST